MEKPIGSISDWLGRQFQLLRNTLRPSRLQLLARDLRKKWIGASRVQTTPQERDTDASDLTDDRWTLLLPFIRRNIHKYTLSAPLKNDMHIVATPNYLQESGAAMKSLTRGVTSEYVVPDHLTHLDIAATQHAHYWVNVVKRIIAKPGTGHPGHDC